MLKLLQGLSAILTMATTALALAGQPSPAALLSALRNSDHVQLEALLRRGADANARLADGSVPLSWAVDMQDRRAVELLLRHRAAVDDPVAAANDFRPLFVACLHPEPMILNMLLDAQVDVRIRGPEQLPVLAACAGRAPLAIVDRMLTAGAPVDASDQRGQTALMWAAAYRRIDVFERLLAAGADPRRRTQGGFSVTMFAVKSGSARMARRALAASGDPGQRAADGTSLLQLAMYQQNYAFAADLIALGANFEAYDRNGRQVLHAAVLAQQPALVAQLLTAGADVAARTAKSTVRWRYESNFRAGSYEFPAASPLELAAAQGSASIMRQLIAGGADPHAPNLDGEPLALAAAGSGDPAALRVALDYTGDANVHDARGQTPLHRVLDTAEDHALGALLRVLAVYGAQPDIEDSRGRTAAEIAGDEHFRGRATYAALFGPAGAPAPVSNP
ncbi:MAG: ankyrin repeat domain-containing protein [Pseudomonadota bacterium]